MNNGTVAQTQHQGLKEPQVADPPAEIYSFKGTRIMEACGCVAVGLFFCFFAAAGAHAPFVLSFIAASALASVGLWYNLRSPYELRIGPSGLLRFTSVTGSNDLRAAHIVRLVRRERVSNGKLDHIRVEHRAGSITLGGREDVFARLAQLVPAAHVSTEQYDPD